MNVQTGASKAPVSTLGEMSFSKVFLLRITLQHYLLMQAKAAVKPAGHAVKPVKPPDIP